MGPGQDHALAQADGSVGDQRSASTVILVPRPEHSGQAPNGALNEKVRGSISVSWSGWPFGQDSFSEKLRQAASAFDVHEIDRDETIGEPQRGLERVGQAGQDVVGRATRRSTMTEMSCLTAS